MCGRVTWRVDMITPDVSTARERVVLRLVCELGARAIAGGIPTHLSQRQGSPHLYKPGVPVSNTNTEYCVLARQAG